jgi:hypothetical protein
MKIDFCVECRGSGKILEQRLSEYANSYDYYPVTCPRCQTTGTHMQQRIRKNIQDISAQPSKSYHIVYRNET